MDSSSISFNIEKSVLEKDLFPPSFCYHHYKGFSPLSRKSTMESLAKVHSRHQPLPFSINLHRSSFAKPVSSLSFRAPSSSSPFKFSSIRASSSSSTETSRKPSLLQTLNPFSSPIIRTTCITVAAAALFFMRLQHNRPAIAAPVAAPMVEPTEDSSASSSIPDDVSFDEKERQFEQYLAENPGDVEALRLLMEIKLKSRKLQEAVEVIERLIEVEPNEPEWPLLKAQVYTYAGDFESASKGFEEILQKDPLRVEAYHGLVMSYDETGYKLKELEKRIESAMEKCKKENKKSDLRDFRLLIAQIRVMESKYSEALKVYEELVKEEPRDFRPYLCQGIIYTLLKKKDEAENQFEKFRRLVPKNHPYREYFVDNMVATKLFGEKVEREGAGSKV